MTVQSYLDAITLLNDSGKYRVIQKYEKPEYYHLDDGSEKLIGLFLDVETTGIDFKSDKIIELGIVVFEYSSDGKIFRIMDEFTQFKDSFWRAFGVGKACVVAFVLQQPRHR